MLASQKKWSRIVIQDYRYLDIENVSCLLLLLMARMDIDWAENWVSFLKF